MTEWVRVTRKTPCAICGKPDWCTALPGRGIACCMREHRGSYRAADKGNGWLHRLNEKREWYRPMPAAAPKPVPAAIHALAASFHAVMDGYDLDRAAIDLGLPAAALWKIGIGITERGDLSFPMQDARGNTIGVRLRAPDGKKFCITGSRNGLFVPAFPLPRGPLLICEGPTDCAAAAALGFAAIGRPSNVGGLDLIVEYCIGIRREILIVRDRDVPGSAAEFNTLRGAAALAEALAAIGESVKIIAPMKGYKDLRDWFRAGATREMILCVAANARVFTKLVQLPIEPADAKARCSRGDSVATNRPR